MTTAQQKLEELHKQLPISLEEFRAAMQESGFCWRFQSIDGASCIVTRDYVPERFNVSIVKTKIVNIQLG